ncbi:MAG: hypothetical protein WBQ68_15455 [Terriglobales bacterium]
MNASAAVRVFERPRAGPAFRRIEAGEDAEPQYGWDARVESIRNILHQDGHTITQLSAATRTRYGSGSPYFIPATFLYQLKIGVTPHVCQVAALSENTGYRFVDWLQIFGFDLRQIPRLQIRLHPLRTILVTPMEDSFDPFPSELSPGDESAAQWSRRGEWNEPGRYLFAKIGSSDAVGCSRLRPGNIVRVDRYYAQRLRGLDAISMSHLLWLVELPDGLTCSQLRWVDDRQIVLLPSRPPWGRWPLRLLSEARILGLVDTDFRAPRPLKLQHVDGSMNLASINMGSTNPEARFTPYPRDENMSFSELLRSSRRRAGLTFREAHRLTRLTAQILGDREYGIALGMLSDYEAMGKLPRHIAKILTLCVVYCMDVRALMEAAGMRVDDSAKLPIPRYDAWPQVRSEFLDHNSHPATRSLVNSYVRSAGSQP